MKRDLTYLSLIANVAGVQYDLHNVNERLIGWNGLGVPNTRRLSQRYPTQDGDSDLGRRIDARFVDLFWQIAYPDLPAYYEGREKFIDCFQPREDDATQLIFTFPDGTRRALDVNVDGSLDFPSNDRRGRVQKFGLVVKASDWRLYDPDIKTSEYVLLQSTGGLPVPFTVPVPIGRGLQSTTNTIFYANGSRIAAKEFPVITIYGPITSPVIENLTTNEKIDLSANGGLVLLAGEFITIDLNGGDRRDSKPIINQDGDSVQNFLTTDSQLLTWHLSYNGEKLSDGAYSDGNNVVRITGNNVTSATRAIINYYDRYKGK